MDGIKHSSPRELNPRPPWKTWPVQQAHTTFCHKSQDPGQPPCIQQPCGQPAGLSLFLPWFRRWHLSCLGWGCHSDPGRGFPEMLPASP
jgi:hypothetical protein